MELHQAIDTGENIFSLDSAGHIIPPIYTFFNEMQAVDTTLRISATGGNPDLPLDRMIHFAYTSLCMKYTTALLTT
jgi:hypothetical protein